ncbi:GNAT family N-acetyltransferase [Andreprevotia chitinilytica]|uniref:GNAT family N-acetyltransferase n=1 Tax=Andreprevotia chitinilytica TaxID=396808 RepID=UPI00068CB8BA|nr:GNAT family N-acetyltransferase [Andreprevotia chitinilytica]
MISPAIAIRPLRNDDISAAAALARHAFDAAVAPTLSPEGCATFYAYVLPDALSDRHRDGYLTQVVEVDGQLAGLAQLKPPGHLCMLFVAPSLQRLGLGGRLADAIVVRAVEYTPSLTEITVNASLNAVHAYEHFGFVATDVAQTRFGLRYVPMRRVLNPA